MKDWPLWRRVVVYLLLAVLLVVGVSIVVGIRAVQRHQGRYLVLLQNTDELRATGGFMGAYTILDWASSEPFRFTLRDIYDPSGMSSVLPSPPGQGEYLSGGDGLRLVDANWDADFPTSAERILWFFEHIHNDPQQYDGVITVPLTLVEDVLAALGSVYLPDQAEWVSAETLATVARRDRELFFPGSQEKTQVLQGLTNALLLKLAELRPSEWRRLVADVVKSPHWRDVQVFARDPALQRLVTIFHLDGSVEPFTTAELFLFPVESNVGINKANRGITRQTEVRVAGQQLEWVSRWTNHFTLADRPEPVESNSEYATAEHLSYVNYQRVLTHPELVVEEIWVGDERVEGWDDELVTSRAGDVYRQVGFLVVVPESTAVTVRVVWSLSTTLAEELTQADRTGVTLQRQSGVQYEAVGLACGSEAVQPLTLARRVYRGHCAGGIE